MATKTEMNNKFFTKEGVNALESKTKSYIRIFNENDFPWTGQFLGFGKITIEDQKECLARILELCNLTGFQAKLEVNKSTKIAEIKY